jgi:hypothetical protein
LNYLSSDEGTAAVQAALNAEGYALVSMTVGVLRISLPIYSDNGVWQSGSTNISFRVNQLS